MEETIEETKDINLDEARAEEARLIGEIEVLQEKARFFRDGIGQDVQEEIEAYFSGRIRHYEQINGTVGTKNAEVVANQGRIDALHEAVNVVCGLAWDEEIARAAKALTDYRAAYPLLLQGQDAGENIIVLVFARYDATPDDDDVLVAEMDKAGFLWNDGEDSLRFSGPDTPENRGLAQRMVANYEGAECRYEVQGGAAAETDEVKEPAEATA